MESKPPTRGRPQPFLYPQFCKACGRCIEACAKHCIEPGTEINPETGLIPVTINLDECSSCGLCMSACANPRTTSASALAGAEAYDGTWERLPDEHRIGRYVSSGWGFSRPTAKAESICSSP